ncbi:MAG: YybS family protein [Gemmatimonadetes bacterium]|nr:YybS family protein [Gemmatimonadota bacterium]
MEGTAQIGGRGWLRAAGLVVATGSLAVVNPLVLVAIPFVLLVVFTPPRGHLSVILAALASVFVAAGDPESGLWYAERGWALLLGGGFLALSLRWPEGKFLAKGLGAVFGAFVASGLLFGVRPGDWAVVDWAVRARLEEAISSFLQAVRVNLGPDALPVGFESRALETMAAQSLIFPALLGLGSLSALGLAWWLFRAVRRNQGVGLGPLREFRFNDQLIWLMILGVLASLVSSGALERIGINAVVFMGALYALRGVGVLLTITEGFPLLGGALLVVGFLIAWPFTIPGAVIIGLGDTWFDLRKSRASPRPEA